MNKIFNLDDFSFTYDKVKETVNVHSYIGPIGNGSVANVPNKILIENSIKEVPVKDFMEVLKGLNVEKVKFVDVFEKISILDIPSLKEVEITGETKPLRELKIANCPILEKVVINPVIISLDIQGNKSQVKVIYEKGCSSTIKLGTNNLHHIFGDDVTEVPTIYGGHITLGKSVKGIQSIKKGEFGIPADISKPEYELPLRIDFLGETPPIVGRGDTKAIPITEINIPAGALDIYKNHPQWGKAAYIVEEGGQTLDNYADKHSKRLKTLRQKQIKKDKISAELKEIEKQKEVARLNYQRHETLALKHLSNWKFHRLVDRIYESYYYINFLVQVGNIGLNFHIPTDYPDEIWEKIALKLKEIEKQMAKN